jgi:hypothetical protein
MRDNVWLDGGSFMLDLEVLHSRDALISAVERLADKGSFAVTIGKAALIADPDNLKTLVTAFPQHFTTRLRLIK